MTLVLSNRSDNHATLGILTLRVRDHTLVLTKHEMDDAALIGIHRREGDLTPTILGTGGGAAGDVFNLLATTRLIALDVDDDRGSRT